MTDNNWSEAIENTIKRFGDDALLLESKYEMQSRWYTFYHNLLMIPSIFISSAASLLTGLNILFNLLGLSITVVVITAVMSALLSIISLFRFETSAKSSDTISKKYKRLYNRMMAELQKERKFRVDGLVFLDYARRKAGRLNDDSPNLLENIVKMFKIVCCCSNDLEILNNQNEINIERTENNYATDEERIEAMNINKHIQYQIDQYVGTDDNI